MATRECNTLCPLNRFIQQGNVDTAIAGLQNNTRNMSLGSGLLRGVVSRVDSGTGVGWGRLLPSWVHAAVDIFFPEEFNHN